jgi:hypothetical protein
MILTDLLGSKVFGPDFLGYVTDARFVLDPPSSDQPMPTARLYGLVVSPHARSSSLGFERDIAVPSWSPGQTLPESTRNGYSCATTSLAGPRYCVNRRPDLPTWARSRLRIPG